MGHYRRPEAVERRSLAKVYRKYVDGLEKLISWMESNPIEVGLSPA